MVWKSERRRQRKTERPVTTEVEKGRTLRRRRRRMETTNSVTHETRDEGIGAVGRVGNVGSTGGGELRRQKRRTKRTKKVVTYETRDEGTKVVDFQRSGDRRSKFRRRRTTTEKKEADVPSRIRDERWRRQDCDGRRRNGKGGRRFWG